ncbi:hypothetical protein HPB47_022203 [Ixodes persulcatus]|uniref:Uncharacterized protein n=1 Tax=Ixodes persulcatus TaxID=34615 RepID=A0AC60QDP9_IXOPE|nr:hypothetical protein HPB47_022203 [Ixodes persulcatus]
MEMLSRTTNRWRANRTRQKTPKDPANAANAQLPSPDPALTRDSARLTDRVVQSSVLAESSGIAASTLFTFLEIHADTAESSCPVTYCPPCADRCDHVPSPDHLIGTFETTQTTPTSGIDASRPPLRPFVFSGLGGSMMNRPLSFFFFALPEFSWRAYGE